MHNLRLHVFRGFFSDWGLARATFCFLQLIGFVLVGRFLGNSIHWTNKTANLETVTGPGPANLWRKVNSNRRRVEGGLSCHVGVLSMNGWHHQFLAVFRPMIIRLPRGYHQLWIHFVLFFVMSTVLSQLSFMPSGLQYHWSSWLLDVNRMWLKPLTCVNYVLFLWISLILTGCILQAEWMMETNCLMANKTWTQQLRCFLKRNRICLFSKMLGMYIQTMYIYILFFINEVYMRKERKMAYAKFDLANGGVKFVLLSCYVIRCLWTTLFFVSQSLRASHSWNIFWWIVSP